MKNLKKAAAVTMVAGGLLAAGTGMASATDGSHAHGKAVGGGGHSRTGGEQTAGHHRHGRCLLQVLHFPMPSW